MPLEGVGREMVRVGVDPPGSKVRGGTFAAGSEVVEVRSGETVLEELESAGACAAAIAACLCFSSVTPSIIPTMILRTMTMTRTIIAMPLFVLYQQYGGTGEGESAATG